MTVLEKTFYVLYIVESYHPLYWPVGHYIYYSYLDFNEESVGPGPFPGYKPCKTFEHADTFKTRRLAEAEILKFYNKPIMKNLARLSIKRVTVMVTIED